MKFQNIEPVMNLIKENKLFEATSLLESMSLDNEDRNDLILFYSKLKAVNNN